MTKRYSRMQAFYRYTSFFAFAMVAAGAPSCTTDFSEINTNPSAVTANLVNVNNLLTRVQKEAIFDSYDAGYITEFAGYYSNPATATLSARDWADPFTEFYRTYLINISEVIRLSRDKPESAGKNAIARIMKAWIFHQLTDLYGDVPYFEAALDVNQVINYPAYDRQEDIYKDLLKELKEAEHQLSILENQVSFGPSDLIYQGNTDKWRRFANSLRLRLAVRARFAAPDLASGHIQDVIGKPLISGNEFNAALMTEGEAASNTENRNPMYNSYLSNTVPKYATNTMADNLILRNDPRLPVYLTAAPKPQNGKRWKGRPLALDLDQEDTDESYRQEELASLGALFHAAGYQIKLLTAAEVSFLRAEAALAGLTTESAAEMLEKGIRQAMEMYAIPSALTENYLLSRTKAFNTFEPEQKLEEIIVQKWIAGYYQSREAWAEYRRTGYPVIWVGKAVGDTEGQIPRRLTYPSGEYLRNGKRAEESAARLEKGDVFMSRIWWDKRPGLPFRHPRQGMFPPELASME